MRPHVLERRIGVGKQPQCDEDHGEDCRRQKAALDHEVRQKNKRRRLDRGGQRQRGGAQPSAVDDDSPKPGEHDEIGQRIVGLPLEYREHEFNADDDRHDAQPCQFVVAPAAGQQPHHQFFGNRETSDSGGDGDHIPDRHAQTHRHRRERRHQEREGRRIAEQLGALAQRRSLQHALGRFRVEGHADGIFGEARKICRCRHNQRNPGPILAKRVFPCHVVPPCSNRNNTIPDGPAKPPIASITTI